MKNLCTYLVLLWILMSCEEATQWDIKATSGELLVVEAQITNERKPQQVRLSKAVAGLNMSPEPVSGATVAVAEGSNIALFAEYPQGSGTYYSDTVQAVVGKVYQLYIQVGDQEYTARAEMVPVTPLKKLEYRRVSSDSALYAINFQDSNVPSKKEYWISWGHVPGYEDLPTAKTLAHTYYYTLESIDVNQLFKPDQQEISFPAGTVVLRKKYSLSEAQQAFYRTFLSETQWRGSPFDIQKGNVITNLSDGAVGFFGVSSVVSDTTLILP